MISKAKFSKVSKTIRAFDNGYEQGRMDGYTQGRMDTIDEGINLVTYICKKYKIPILDMDSTIKEWEEKKGRNK